MTISTKLGKISKTNCFLRFYQFNHGNHGENPVMSFGDDV